MPNGEANRLGNLATTGAPSMAPSDQTAMEQMPSRTAPPSPEGAQPEAPGTGGGDQKMDQVGRLMVELADVAQEMTQVDPRTTMIVKEAVQKLYLSLSRIYGVEDEAKLRMKKAQGQVQGQSMNTLGNL